MIRTFFRPVSLSLIAFMGLAGLTACSSSDDASDEPNVNPGDAVKTSFTLSVGLPNGNRSNAKPATRVSDEVAQVNSNFRGIDNISLLPFSTAIGTTEEGTTSNAPKIELAEMTATNVVSTDSRNARARVYNDVNINVGTNHFLFYGKAINAAAAEGSNSQFTNGDLTVAGLNSTDPVSTSAISFTPTSIYNGTLSSEEKVQALVAYLNSIAGTTSGNTTWASYATSNSGRPLTTLYNNFVGLTAGSSASIQKAVQELFTSLKNLSTQAGGNNLTEGEAALRDAIVNNITSATYVSNGTNAEANTTLTFNDNISGFPGNINLPDGAATLSFNNGQFSENTESQTLTDGLQTANLSSFAYPANLWYFDNTDIKTSVKALSDQYTEGTTWQTILNNYEEDPGSVSATTRSIALKNQIQYAVGRLEATVKAGAATLYDKNGAAVNVTDNSFPVTAIIIGGQRKVNWNFQPNATPNSDAQYSLYDKVSKSIYATTNNTTTNNTLALETPASEAVNVAVELTNNTGKQFEGKDGVVPAGGKFYLIAQLNPTTVNNATINQVFKQDYVTKATLTINVNTGDSRNQGLGNAYNVIPDLRTPVLSLGMSVDLQWQNGLTFNVDM